MPTSALLVATLLSCSPATAQGTEATCDEASMTVACASWGEHQQPVCLQLEQVKCCMQGGSSQAQCCEAANAEIQMFPLCRSSATSAHGESLPCTEAMQAACQGCSGVQECKTCYEEEDVKCCRQQGGAMDLCCHDQAASIRTGPLCTVNLLGSASASPCDAQAVEAECFGCSSKGEEACQSCREEEAVKCCVEQGGTLHDCCSAAPAATQSGIFCTSTSHYEGDPTSEVLPCSPAAVEADCKGRSDLQTCIDEEYLHCCLLSPVGSKAACCPVASAEAQVAEGCRLNLGTTSRSQLLCTAGVLRQACQDCTGVTCHTCYQEQDVRCCLDNGGSPDLCCDDASDEVRATLAQCQANMNILP